MARASTTRTVYLPCDPATAEAFRRSGQLERAEGVSVDVAYGTARDLDLAVGDDEEEADYWALTDAAMLGLGRQGQGPRFVVAARVRPHQLETAGAEGSGRVTATALAWAQVSALFIDDADALPALEAARAALGDPELLAERVARLVVEHDLLWYAPDELDGLLD